MPDMTAAPFVQQICHSADSIAQKGGRDMITAHLLPHSVLVASDDAERTDAGNGLRQRKRGTTMQNTEGLASILVNRHRCLHTVNANIGVSDAKHADKAAFILLVQFFEVNRPDIVARLIAHIGDILA